MLRRDKPPDVGWDGQRSSKRDSWRRGEALTMSVAFCARQARSNEFARGTQSIRPSFFLKPAALPRHDSPCRLAQQVRQGGR